MTRYKVAIVGAGIGAEHAAAYRNLPARFEVRTICDLDVPRAELIVTQTPGARSGSDFQQVLADPEIDIVDICLPPHLHLQHCIAALQAGKHVVCEKPLVASLAEADQLHAAMQASGQQLFPVFQYRYGRGARQLRALIDAGLAGTPFTASLETHWNRGGIYYEPEWRGTWRGEQGGALLNHAIHIHDWLSFILGPVASVFARIATRVNPIEVEDCAALSIEMENGALATSSITLGAATDTSRLRFCFSELTAESGSLPYAPASDEWQFTARVPAQQAAVDAVVDAVNDVPAGFEGLFAAVAETLDGNPGRQVTIADARRSLEFVTAAYASAREQQPVAMPLQSSHPLYDSWLPSES